MSSSIGGKDVGDGTLEAAPIEVRPRVREEGALGRRDDGEGEDGLFGSG